MRSADDIIGKMISTDGVHKFPVVGVVKDYNSRSLREVISPVLISSEYNAYEWIAVRMERARLNTTLPNVRKLFTSIYPSYLYDQTFFDERIETFYKNEATTSQLFKIFSFLAIMISCLGLYGLVSFMAIQKTKEVGIRKVLGASVQSIVYLFSREFTLLIALAFVIAAPLGYFLMNKWLSGFYYHTAIGVWVFLAAILGSVVIAWLTVGYQSIKAARANPVDSLRHE